MYLTPDDETGSSDSATAVLYTEQNLTDEQKAQARDNIGALSSTYKPDWSDITNKPFITEGGDTLTWDGDTVYRKIISVGKLPNNTEMSLTVENAAKIVSIDGYIAKGNYNIPIYAPNAAISSIYYNNSTNVLYITTSADRSDWDCYLDVKYTK